MAIFYKIIAPTGKESHLFGTMHVGDAEVINLATEAMQVMDTASLLVVEPSPDDRDPLDPDVNIDALKARLIKEWYAQQVLVHEDISKSAFYEFHRSGFLNFKTPPEKDFDTYFYNLIAPFTPPIYEKRKNNLQALESQEFFSSDQECLDSQLSSRAREKGIPILHVETLEETYTHLMGLHFTYAEHLEYFNYFQQHDCKLGTALLDPIKDFYLQQNLQGPQELWASTHANGPEISKKYAYGIRDSRDETMFTRLVPHLLTTNVFIGVGAAHLPGIIQRLENAGFQVHPITLHAPPLCNTIHPGSRRMPLITANFYSPQSSVPAAMATPTNPSATQRLATPYLDILRSTNPPPATDSVPSGATLG